VWICIATEERRVDPGEIRVAHRVVPGHHDDIEAGRGGTDVVGVAAPRGVGAEEDGAVPGLRWRSTQEDLTFFAANAMRPTRPRMSKSFFMAAA
jgi:hypothetical protein